MPTQNNQSRRIRILSKGIRESMVVRYFSSTEYCDAIGANSELKAAFREAGVIFRKSKHRIRRSVIGEVAPGNNEGIDRNKAKPPELEPIVVTRPAEPEDIPISDYYIPQRGAEDYLADGDGHLRDIDVLSTVPEKAMPKMEMIPRPDNTDLPAKIDPPPPCGVNEDNRDSGGMPPPPLEEKHIRRFHPTIDDDYRIEKMGALLSKIPENEGPKASRRDRENKEIRFLGAGSANIFPDLDTFLDVLPEDIGGQLLDALHTFVDFGGTDAVFAMLLKVLQLASGLTAYKKAWRLAAKKQSAARIGELNQRLQK